MLVRTKEDTAREWCTTVIVVTHRSGKLGMVVIRDTKNRPRPTLIIQDDPEEPTINEDYLIKIYGVDAMGKVVDEYPRGKCHLKKR